ncbi:hypothetical protein [Hoeflea sp.]|uniref:hypothetical protein n=1 Tax=Hoeflea sp. TaxID=1940281 RepID=UPI0019A08982|nr:hypothetical protein [Hoeflea sp.]MBC7282621.1 hypothetical protein [Hoeflea sp.]
MNDFPASIRIDPDYSGWDSQVIGWNSEQKDSDGNFIAPREWPRYVRADLYEALLDRVVELECKMSEARRRRDEWKKKAEGYDAVCMALREKVGAPWPANMSRIMWAGIAAAEKRRADKAFDKGIESAARVADEYEPQFEWSDRDAAGSIAEDIRALKGGYKP